MIQGIVNGNPTTNYARFIAGTEAMHLGAIMSIADTFVNLIICACEGLPRVRDN